MAKKKKNSNYRYLLEKEDKARQERERQERNALKRKNRWIYASGVLLLTTGFVVCLLEYAKVISGLTPFFVGISSVGLFCLWYTFKETRPKYATACIVVAVLFLFYAFYIFRNMYMK